MLFANSQNKDLGTSQLPRGLSEEGRLLSGSGLQTGFV